MRKIIIFVLFVCFMSALSFPTNVTASVMFSTPVKGVVTEQGVDVKKGPDLKEKTLCRISEKGTSVKVLGKADKWFKVKVGPCEGWIQGAFMDVEKDTLSPVAAEAKPVAATEGATVQDAGDAFVPFSIPQRGVITERKVNIRKGPDSGEKILCRIYVPDEYVDKKSVKVLGRQGEWFKVKFGTCLGWIKKDDVSLDRITPVPDQKIATETAAKEADAALRAEKERQAALKKQKEEAERQTALKKQKEEAERQEALSKQKVAAERQAAMQRQKTEAEKQASAERQFLYPAPKQGVLTQKKVNIRKGPNDKEKILCRIYVPAEFVNEKAVSVLGRQGDWYKVKFGSCLGWIQEDYIALKAVTPAPKTEMAAAAEPMKKSTEPAPEKRAPAAEPEVVKPEKTAAVPEKPEKTAKPRFAESSVLFLPSEEGTEEDKRISLKKGPSSNEKTLCQIYIPAPYVKDTWVTVIDQKGDWYEVKMGSCQGWIEGTYLALTRETPGPVRKAEPSVEDREKMLALQKEKEEQEALKEQKAAAARREALRRQEEEKKKLAAAESFVLFPEPQKGTVTNEKVNVKEGPGTAEKTLCRVTGKGKSLTVLGRQSGWYKVKVGRCEGWVQTAYLALEAVTPAAEEKMLAAAAEADAAEKKEQARQEALQKQKAEEARQEELRKQEEEQARQEALRNQQESEARQAALTKQQEAEARQAALRKEREEAERQEASRRQAAEKKKLAAPKRLVMFPEPQKGVLNDKKIDLKKGPDAGQKTLCRLPEKGTPVKVLGRQGDWYKVEVQRCIGWVQAAYLTMEEVSPAAEKAMIAAAAAEEEAVAPEEKIQEEVLEEEVIEHEEAVKKTEEEVVEEEVELKKVTTGATIKEIAFTGNTVIDTETLKELTASFTDKDLTLDEMNAVADLVTMTYQENGYILAKAFLPVQDITKGVLTIAVLEGKIGKIKVKGNTYYKDRVLSRYFRPQMKLGVAKEKYLEKGLLFTKDLPYADTELVLTKGEERGTVDVLLNTEDRIAFKWGFDYNNFGNEAVSEDRYGTTVEITEPWWGSRLAMRGTVGNIAEDSTMGNIDLFVPLNGYGTQFRIGYLKSIYAVGQDLADLQLKGFAQVWGGEISHPLMKTRNKNLYLIGNYERKYTENEILGDVRAVDEENSGGVKLKFDSLDRYLGKNIASLEWQYGHVRPEDRAPISRLGVDTINQRFRGSLARIQKVYGYTNLMVRATGQISDDRLLPINQVVIGGYGSARGHEPSIYLGDSGYTLSGEFMFSPPFIADKSIFGQRVAQLAQFALFYDAAGVFQNNIIGSEDRSEYLSGYGGGVRLFYKNIFSFRWDIGFPTAKLPGAREHINYFQVFVNIF